MKKGSSFLILLIVFCACCGITYVSIKGLNTTKKEDTKETSKKEESKADEQAINKTINYLKVLEIWGKDIIPSELTNEELIFFVYKNSEDFYDQGISLTEAQDFAKKYLGVELKKGSMQCPNGKNQEPNLIIFDESSNKFVANPEHGAHGGGGTQLNTMNKIDKIDYQDGIYVVTVKKIFSAPYGDIDISTIYYNNYKSAMNRVLSEAVYEDIDEPLANEKEYDQGINRDANKIDYSKASTYEYKFKVVDGIYQLVSYKEIK